MRLNLNITHLSTGPRQTWHKRHKKSQTFLGFSLNYDELDVFFLWIDLSNSNNNILNQWNVDLSQTRCLPLKTKVIRIVLGIKNDKRPDTTGICDVVYKICAIVLAEVFLETITELQDLNLDDNNIPMHLRTGL